MEKYQFFYLLGIALGWLARRYFDVSGPVLIMALIFATTLYVAMNWMWP